MNKVQTILEGVIIMKKRLITVIMFIFIVALVGCSSDGDKLESGNNKADIPYDEATFDISLSDISGNIVNVSPDGKTIYAYFTGIS